MSESLQQWCRRYLADELSVQERIEFETRLAAGEPELVAAFEASKGFPQPKETALPNLPDAPKLKPAPEIYPPKKVIENPIKTETNSTDKRRWGSRLAGLLALAAVLYAMYLQWALLVATSNKEALQSAIVELQGSLQKAEQRTANAVSEKEMAVFRQGRIESILTSDQGRVLAIPATRNSHPFRKIFLFIDFSTNRVVARVRVPEESDFTAGIALWIEDRDGKTSKLGTLSPLNPDSLYTDFNGNALIHGRWIEIHESGDGLYSRKSVLVRYKLPS